MKTLFLQFHLNMFAHRKLHKTLGKKLPGFNLLDKQHATVSQKIILKTLEYQNGNPSLSEDEALSQAIESYNNEIRQFKADDIPQDIDQPKFGYKKKPSLVGEYKKALETKVDLQKIMSEEEK